MPAFGRKPFFDERSRSFPIRSLVDVSLPLRSYTWSVPTVLDQGNEGACVGFAYSHELLARPVSVLNQDNVSARALYFEIQQADQWEGGAYPGASPFYEGTSVLAGAQVVQRSGHYSAYHWAFSEQEMALAVGYKGPVVIGINWYTGMMRPDSQGFLDKIGSVEGGHAILVNSINIAYDRYRVHNSWGPGWGTKGGAFIRRATMAALLAEGGECCLPTRVRF